MENKNTNSDEEQKQEDAVIVAIREEYEKKFAEQEERHKQELAEVEQKHVSQIRALMSGKRFTDEEEQKKAEETVQKTYEQTVLEQAQKILKI